MNATQTPSIQVTDTIKAIIINNNSEWTTLRALRDRLGQMTDLDITRDQVDEALADLLTAKAIRLIPESNQKTLTDADRRAAIWIGGEYKHLISIR